MTVKKYEVIWDRQINVEMKYRDVGEVFEADSTIKEIKNLAKAGYIKEVK